MNQTPGALSTDPSAGAAPVFRAASELRVTVVTATFPGLTETFVRTEVDGLIERGHAVQVVSCHPTAGVVPDLALHPAPDLVVGLQTPRLAGALLGVVLRHPVTVLRMTRRAWRLRRPGGGARLVLAAVAVAAEVRERVQGFAPGRIHAHFLHLPGVVGALLARELGVPLALSAHARDVFVPEVDLGALTRAADVVLVCSGSAQTALEAHLPDDLRSRVSRVHHGVELGPRPARRHRTEAPFRVLVVARLVPKKGVDLVLRALAQLRDDGVSVTARLLGDGPAAASLARLAQDLDLGAIAELRGAATPAEVGDGYTWADVLVVASRQATDGDRDGIPQVVVEAMAVGLPVIATRVGGIPEIVRDRETGLLVTPEDQAALAAAMRELARDHALRARLAEAARDQVEDRFDARNNLTALLRCFEAGHGG